MATVGNTRSGSNPAVAGIGLDKDAEPEPELSQQASAAGTEGAAVALRGANSGVITMDESGQPLDLSGVNSWSRRLSEVSTSELLQTMAVNAAAPFVLCSRLKVCDFRRLFP